MRSSAPYLSPSEAARRLGVSAKALRLYEQRGLVDPVRTAAGWRAYGRQEMARAREIVALRALGFSLAQVGRVLKGNPEGLEPLLAEHQAALEARLRELMHTVEKVRGVRGAVAQGQTPSIGELAGLLAPVREIRVAFDLPWPWGGERFELRDIRPLNYIIGPLGSGKTRLAHCLAQALPNTLLLGLDRFADGAAPSDALAALLCGLEAEGPEAVVVDMIEQGLDQATQEALIARLRRRGPAARPIFMLTRSCAILDLAAVGPDEAIIFCPANHSPPMQVAARPGAPGYDAVATCLASPDVRARTAGVIAWRPADVTAGRLGGNANMRAF